MNLFERFLTVWVGLCIIAGVLFGQFLPGLFQVISSLEIAKVNIPVGVLVWVTPIPRTPRGTARTPRARWSAGTWGSRACPEPART